MGSESLVSAKRPKTPEASGLKDKGLKTKL
jgi:hypothetical protein